MIDVQFPEKCVLWREKPEMHTGVTSFERGDTFACYCNVWTWTLQNVWACVCNPYPTSTGRRNLSPQMQISSQGQDPSCGKVSLHVLTVVSWIECVTHQHKYMLRLCFYCLE